jgi:1-acyl-sn-glycerol-3-phosphate acyltransferase
MIYFIVRQFCRFIMLRFFVRKIEVNGLEKLPKTGPILIASNHPNSFLDAILLQCAIKRPVWSLARGDAFKKPWAGKLLQKFYMMPIYRLSEGKEYLQKNDDTFERCAEIFKKHGQVLIFSEGICLNQNALLPLKKGTARLAQQIWQTTDLNLQIMPVGITYDSYYRFGKNISINFGELIKKTQFDNLDQDGFFTRGFNENLNAQLCGLAHVKQEESSWTNNPLFYLNIILHWPVYALASWITIQKTAKTVFHDSVFFALLIITLPIYWAMWYFIIY